MSLMSRATATTSSVLQLNSNLFRQGKSIDHHIIASASTLDLHSSTKLIISCAKSGDICAARKVFDEMRHRSVVSWTAMISGYAKNGLPLEALQVFAQMRASDVGANQYTYGTVLSACGGVVCARSGEQVHACVEKGRFARDMIVQSALMDMHLRCGRVEDARRLFAGMEEKDVVSWNALIRGFVERGLHGDALGFFSSMMREGMLPDHFTFGSALKASSAVSVLANVDVIHACIIKSGYWGEKVVVGSLIDSYAKCRSLSSARMIYESVDEPDLISSTALISGYSIEKNHSKDAMQLFCEIHRKGMQIDDVILSSLLGICANVACFNFGTQIHSFMCKKQPGRDVALGNALVDMYAKSGELSDARRAFDEMPHRNVVSWTSLITACGKHGFGNDAGKFFDRMVEDGVEPNDVTFLSLLSACGHSGLTSKGMEYFSSMVSKYGIHPKAQHYSSGVDLLARGGQLEDALKLVSKMDVEPNSSLWGAMLGACKMHGNASLGETAARCLLSLDPGRSVNYAVLANIYAECGLWEDARRTRTLMSQSSTGKEAGSSSVI